MAPSRRKGISFTLTIVITGVILLMTALSIITLGGTSIENFFGTAQQQEQEAQIQSTINDKCSAKAQRVNTQYCSQYVARNDCSNAQDTRDSSHPITRSEKGDCKWTDSPNFDRTVTVEGGEYDCIDQGVIDNEFCPAQ